MINYDSPKLENAMVMTLTSCMMYSLGLLFICTKASTMGLTTEIFSLELFPPTCRIYQSPRGIVTELKGLSSTEIHGDLQQDDADQTKESF